MSVLPGHTLPTYSEESREDTLLHYTTASGLLGILRNNEIWTTAYYCANDESELGAGKGVLTPLFRSKTHEMIQTADPRVKTFRNRGVDIRDYADQFEQTIFSSALNFFCVYITCFCKPSSEEDFHHGLLSQWRGYGIDGGYALQFSRSKLQAAVERAHKAESLSYELQDVYYSPDNPLKDEVLKHAEAFTSAYLNQLDELANWDFNKQTMRSPIANLPGGPLESLLDFLIHTKNRHFNEEKECRMSLLEPVSSGLGVLPVDYFNRSGLLVPFTRTPPSSFNVLDCVEWIIVGPGPRIWNRFNSVTQMVRNMGLEIKVRPSHIPFSRV
jgi:hypothetical protein